MPKRNTHLGALLKTARTINKKVSLRKAEEDTDISNAYLSQLESGRVVEPSPKTLQRLASYYEISYSELMRAAGYLMPAEQEHVAANNRVQSFLMASGITDADFPALSAFIQFLRQSQNTDSSTTTEIRV